MTEAERFLKMKAGASSPPASNPEPTGQDWQVDRAGGPALNQRLIWLSLASGLFGFGCAFLRELDVAIPLALVAIFLAPPLEEILKIALPIMVLEHRSRWLAQGRDLLWFAMGSALVFAVVENLMYSWIVLEDPGAGLLWWRWIVCTAMHVGATGLSGIGLMRAHACAAETGRPPRFIREWPWLAAAIGLHMTYNFYAVVSDFF